MRSNLHPQQVKLSVLFATLRNILLEKDSVL